MADRAGITACAPRTFDTANGRVEGCLARIDELTFGGFSLRDTEVAVMPNLASEALLGMNVLRLFRMEQQDGALRISARPDR